MRGLTTHNARTIVRIVNDSTGRGRVWTWAFLLVFYAAQVALWLLLLFFVPAMERALADHGEAIPAPTRWVIGNSIFVQGYFFIVAPVCLLGYVGLGVLVGYRGRERWMRVLFGVLAAKRRDPERHVLQCFYQDTT